MTFKLLASATLLCAVWFTTPIVHAMMPQQRVSCEPEIKLLTEEEVLLSKKPEVPTGWQTFAYSQNLETAKRFIVKLNLARVIHASGALESEIKNQNEYLVEALEASGAGDVLLSGADVRNGCYRLKVIYTMVY
jgi:hypothetical protein